MSLAPAETAIRVDASKSAATVQFLIRIAAALQAHGAPAHRLEQALHECAHHLRTDAEFFSSPTSLIIAFGSDDRQHTNLVRTCSGPADLGRLVALDALLFDIAERPVCIEAANERLDIILDSQNDTHTGLDIVSNATVSAGALCFFGGTVHELWMATLLGGIVGVLPLWVNRDPDRAPMFEPIAAFMAAVLASLLSTFIVPVEATRVTVTALIALVPGLSLTVAINELAMRHLASGTARLAGVVTVFFTMTFGVGIGRKLFTLAEADTFHPVWTQDWPLPDYAWILATLISPFAFAVLFRARRADIWPIFIAATLGIVTVRVSQPELGPEYASFLGSLVVTLFSNFYARTWGKPALVAILPGLLMLVPGSMGFRSLDLFMSHDVITGMATAFEAMLVAICLVGGLLTANIIYPPRRAL